MLDRREFVAATLLLATSSAMAMPPLASLAVTDTNSQVPELFIYDKRFPQAQQRADCMAAANIELAPIEGDFTELWSNKLRPRWKQGPRVVAGVTNERGLFVLKTLAADHRMKLQQSVKLEQPVGSEPLYQWLLVPRGSATPQ